MNTEKHQKYPYFDALRGIGILLVIIFHTTLFMTHSAPNMLYRLSGEGARGVQLFFMVSALALFLSLDKNMFSGTRIESVKFFFKRFFRITPMFYLMIGIFSVSTLFFPLWKEWLHLDINLGSILSSLTFTNNFIPEYMNAVVPGQWFVAVEMVFIVAIPFLFLRIKNLSTAKRFFLWSLVFASLIELILPLFFPLRIMEDVKIFLFYTVPIQLPSFLLGIVAFFILFKNKEENGTFQKKEFLFLLGATFVCEVIFVIAKFLITKRVDLSLITPRIYVESVFLLGLIILFSNGYLRLLQNKIFQYLGKVSYSMYLIHFICLIIITKNSIYPKIAEFAGNPYIEFVILLLITTVFTATLASLTLRFVEQPGQKFGMYLYKKIFKND